MYPLINITDTFALHTFGLYVLIAGAVFFILLHVLALRKWMVHHIFSDILPFILNSFFFGRLFYILAEWREEQFLFRDLVEGSGFFRFLSHFFLTENYNLSFAWCVIWFFIVFFFKTRKNKTERSNYYDVIIPSFLVASVFGYLGSFFGWELYGTPYNGIFAITYDSKDSIVPFRNSLFPLPFVYILTVLLILSYLFKIERKKSRLPPGFIWYLGMWIFGITVFFLEFFNGSTDMFSSSFFHINLTQIMGVYFIFLAFIWLWKSLTFENLS